MNKYIVAAIGDWNQKLFSERHDSIEGQWEFVTTPENLSKALEEMKPRYIFFLHWRWIVPKEIVTQYECVCFHMTDLPFGRGGSPLQNLIIRGHKKTVLTALRMDEGIDTGPIYYKEDLDLSGKAQEIYHRASQASWNLIEKIVENSPIPKPQEGDGEVFKRRTPKDSQIPPDLELVQIYDFIRMLDAPGYPNSFIELSGYRMEFCDATLEDDCVRAQVKIMKKEN